MEKERAEKRALVPEVNRAQMGGYMEKPLEPFFERPRGVFSGFFQYFLWVFTSVFVSFH